MDEGRRRREGEKDGGKKEPGYVTSARERGGEGEEERDGGSFFSIHSRGKSPASSLPPSLSFTAVAGRGKDSLFLLLSLVAPTAFGTHVL